VDGILERLGSRLPAWLRPVHRGRWLAAAAVVLLIAVLAVSCNSAGGTVDVPVQQGSADGGVDGVRAPSTARGGTLRVSSPPDAGLVVTIELPA
jgi:peptide/nickel transport system substrate-binding protein